MLSSCLFKKPFFVNKSLQDYCRKSTEESIKKISERYNLERNKPKINIPLDDENSSNKPEINYYGLFTFLSVTTLAIFLYKRLK
jgi:hypothetical protein